jgi:hypothetical protein
MVVGSAALVSAALSGVFVVFAHPGWLRHAASLGGLAW